MPQERAHADEECSAHNERRHQHTQVPDQESTSFRSAASGFLSAGTTRSPFLLRLAAGLSGQQPRAAAFAPKPRVINWHSGSSSSHRLPRPGPVTPFPGRGAAAGSRLACTSAPGSAGPAARATTSPPLPCGAARERPGRDPGRRHTYPAGCRCCTKRRSPPGRAVLARWEAWPRPLRRAASCRPAAWGGPLHGLRRMSIIYREDHQTGKVRHLPDAPAFGRPAASAPRYRRRAARPEDVLRFQPDTRCLPEIIPQARPDAMCGRPARDRVAHWHLAQNPPSMPLRTATAISAGRYSRSGPGSPEIRR